MKIVFFILFIKSLVFSQILGVDLITEYGEVTYVCENDVVVVILELNGEIRKIPVVTKETNIKPIRLKCKDYENWVKEV